MIHPGQLLLGLMAELESLRRMVCHRPLKLCSVVSAQTVQPVFANLCETALAYLMIASRRFDWLLLEWIFGLDHIQLIDGMK